MTGTGHLGKEKDGLTLYGILHTFPELLCLGWSDRGSTFPLGYSGGMGGGSRFKGYYGGVGIPWLHSLGLVKNLSPLPEWETEG
jgi:hypothetical protein